MLSNSFASVWNIQQNLPTKHNSISQHCTHTFKSGLKYSLKYEDLQYPKYTISIYIYFLPHKLDANHPHELYDRDSRWLFLQDFIGDAYDICKYQNTTFAYQLYFPYSSVVDRL